MPCRPVLRDCGMIVRALTAAHSDLMESRLVTPASDWRVAQCLMDTHEIVVHRESRGRFRRRLGIFRSLNELVDRNVG